MPAGMVGPSGLDHVLALDSLAGVTEVGVLPSCCVSRSDHQYYGPVGLPLPSARLHHWLIRTVVADQAGKTGLSCSEPNRAYVPLPLPREDPTRGIPERR